MGKLDDVSSENLRGHLETVETAKAAQRLMIALAYKDGVPVPEMSKRYGIPASTLYYWLDRFEERPIVAAIEDEARPGRPSKLAESERAQFESALHQSPETVGYDGSEWTPTLAQQYLEIEFGVTYSTGHIRNYFGHLL